MTNETPLRNASMELKPKSRITPEKTLNELEKEIYFEINPEAIKLKSFRGLYNGTINVYGVEEARFDDLEELISIEGYEIKKRSSIPNSDPILKNVTKTRINK